jgi:hypothetical protein
MHINLLLSCLFATAISVGSAHKKIKLIKSLSTTCCAEPSEPATFVNAPGTKPAGEKAATSNQFPPVYAAREFSLVHSIVNTLILIRF